MATTDYTNTYVGARYVPKFEDYNASSTYEPLTMVVSGGSIYISKQYVPAGISISNTNYWAKMPAIDSDSEQVIDEAVNDWLNDHPEATTTVQDGAITTAKLADGAVTDSKLSSDGIKLFLGYQEIEFEGPSRNYYNLSGDVAILSQASSSSNKWYIVKYPCVENDKFIVSGQIPSSTAPRSWAFIDENDNILSVADPQIMYDNYEIIAPENSSFVIFEQFNSKPIAIKLTNKPLNNVFYVDDLKNKFNYEINESAKDIVFYGKNLIWERKLISEQGTITSSSTSCLSNFIEITKDCYIVYDGPSTFNDININNHIAIYDINDNFISRKQLSSGTTKYFVKINANSKIRFLTGITVGSGYNYFTYYALTNFIAKITNKSGVANTTYFFTVPINEDFQNNDDITQNIQDSETYANIECALKLPSNYTNYGEPTKLIMFAHGSGGYVSSNTATTFASGDDFINNGYALFDVNGGEPYDGHDAGTSQCVGSPRALNAYFKAYEYIVEKFNIDPLIYVAGISMGGLAALNFTFRYPEIVRCVGLRYPVTDMYNQAWLHPWRANSSAYPTRKAIAREYNFTVKETYTDEDYEPEKIIGFNPSIHNKIDNELLFPRPIKIWHGNIDASVNYIYSVNFINMVRNAGCEGYMRIVENAGHGATGGFTGWNELYGTECSIWFNRFR